MNAFTAREHTAFYARLPARAAWPSASRCSADVLTAPALRPAEVEAERQVIVEEILMNLDAPEDRVHTALSRALFADHPLGREVLGEMPTVEAITRDDIASFFGRWYRPATMVVTAAGRLEHAAVVDAVRAGFDGARRRRAARRGWRPAAAGGARGRRARRHRAGPPQPRVAQPHQPGRRPLGAVGRQPGARRRHGQPPVPGGARGARPGVLRVLAPHRLRGLRLPHHLLRHRPQARPRGPRRDRRRARRRCWPTASPTTSSPSPPATSRARCSSASRTAAAAWPASAAASCSATTSSPIDEHVARLRAVTTDDVSRVLHRVLDSPRTLAAVGPFDADELAAPR